MILSKDSSANELNVVDINVTAFYTVSTLHICAIFVVPPAVLTFTYQSNTDFVKKVELKIPIKYKTTSQRGNQMAVRRTSKRKN